MAHEPASPATPDEAENVEVVRNFFADWSRRDAALLARYLADDFAYQMIEGEPDLVGPAQFVATLEHVLPGFVEIDMHIRRIESFGHLVMVERYDRMIGEDEAHSMCFEVVAILVVEDGKLKMLRDFPIPGGVFELGAAFDAGSAEDRRRLDAARE
ncbi:MAG: nuclear transport factor 2 family protein [Gammaproteobacteria bacterium]